MTTDDQIETALRDRTRFRHCLHLASCDSTQDVAAAAARNGDAVFWADHQSRGRGRQSRVWDDTPGLDLLVTFRVTTKLPKPLALAASLPVAVLRAVEPLASRNLRVKWPNDLFLDGQKLCGVLIDTGMAGPDTYLVGIGVNCNRMRFPPELEAIATSLAIATGREVDRGALLLAIAGQLDQLLRDLEQGRDEPWLGTFRDRLQLLGQRVTVDATTTHEGVLTNVDFDRLVLDGARSLPLAIVRGLRRVAERRE
ncbi:MAG: biotin--[acetyl-CoA-carboxylase] ligase [Planctomycetes bacterium]|nr:biotin--[acetyl-CoA-carboxylase] ligase [Planctomycetota bacterium]